ICVNSIKLQQPLTISSGDRLFGLTGEANRYYFACVSLAPDRNWTVALNDHRFADHIRQDYIRTAFGRGKQSDDYSYEDSRFHLFAPAPSVLNTLGDWTPVELVIFTGAPSAVRSSTLFMVQLSANSMLPARFPWALIFTHFTFAIGFSGSPAAEKTRPAPTTMTFSIVMLRNSQRPRSAGRTGVLNTRQYGGMSLV